MAEPKVRFKKDDGSSYPAWEQGRFGDLIEVYDEKVTSDCTLPVLTSSKTDGIQYQSDHFGREQLHDITGYNVIPRGYCTYRNRSDGTDFTFNINNLCDRGIVSKFYPVFHTTARCNLYFLMTLMNNESKTVRKIAMTAKGTGQKVLSFLDLQKIEINIPSLEEQQKIADFLSSVDEVITASEQEVANLETQKKAVMKKIFSQGVRFKRADGRDFPEWGKCKALDCCKVFCDGDWIESKDQSERGIRLVQTGNVGNGFFVEKETRKRFISVETFDRLHCTEIFAGDILISRLPDPAGRACIVPDSSERMITAVDCTIVRPDDNRLITEYLVQFYQSSVHFKYVNNMLAGGTRQRVSRGNLEEEEVLLPSLEEQRLIADFLSNFDEAIAAAKKELELWKELKKGLLQKMFV